MCMFCIKHEYSHMSLKNNVSSIWICKNIICINHNIKFIWILYESMKLDKFVMEGKKKIEKYSQSWWEKKQNMFCQNLYNVILQQ